MGYVVGVLTALALTFLVAGAIVGGGAVLRRYLPPTHPLQSRLHPQKLSAAARYVLEHWENLGVKIIAAVVVIFCLVVGFVYS